MKTFLKYQLPPILWIIFIYLLTVLPIFRFDLKVASGTDKIVHAVVYFILCGLVRRAFYHQEMLLILRKSALLGAFIFSVVFGVLQEYHQNFIPGRVNDPYNVVANLGGTLLFVALSWLLRRYETGEDEHNES